MRRVYILGAGASHFTGFPLGGGLLLFLRSEWKNTKDLMVKDIGGYALDFIEKAKFSLSGKRVLRSGEPDLEFILALTERNSQYAHNAPNSHCLTQDLDSMARQLDLHAWDLPRVRQGFTTLVASAFLYKSYQVLNKDSATADEDFTTISAAWVEHLNPGDTLITFNWDLLQEILLSKAGKWSYEDGYGVQTTPEKPLNQSPIAILKLHGSCNWALTHPQDQFLRIDYTDVFFTVMSHGLHDSAPVGSTSDYGTSLIVPSYLKNPYRVLVLRSVWEKARDALSKAENMIVLGYSLPNADQYSKMLIREALLENTSMKSIILVLGTDDGSYESWETLCKECGKESIRARQNFEEFISTRD